MKRTNFILLLFLFVASSCNEFELDYESIQAQYKAFTENIVDGVESPLFGLVNDARAYKEKIYFLDVMSMKIKVFDTSGKHLNDIGERGRGPGQIMNMQTFAIAEDENKNPIVLIMDDVNRKLLFLDEHGELIEERLFGEEPYIKGKLVEADLDKQVLKILANRPSGIFSDCLLHSISMIDFSTISCTGSFSSLGYTKGTEQDFLLQINPGYISYTKTDYIYSPSLFSGKMAIFSDLNTNWLESNQINSINPIAKNKKPYEYQLTYRGRQYNGRIKSQSEGLYFHNNKLMHLFSLDQKGKNYFIEIFNDSFSESKLYKLEGLEHFTGSNKLLFLPVLHNNKLYYFDINMNTVYTLSLPF